jgi:2-oxoglutarate ferredoxin oxidoreductase subunit alpha
MRSRSLDATFIQMEDEISALAAVLGAAWTGKKALSVTSGPGFSLMMEHIGLGIMLETPCVILSVQRGGPGEGSPNQPAQGDIMQSRWGSHGDYEIIALAPNSAQECFELTIRAFNLAERFRVPVVLLSDQKIGNTKEKVRIPAANKIQLHPRRYFKQKSKQSYLPYAREADLIPPIVKTGDGFRFHVTGLTHDERGYPIMNAECQEYCVRPLLEKINKYSDEIIDFQEDCRPDDEIFILSYGLTSKIVEQTVKSARKAGFKIGSLRLKTIWPFPEKRVRELARKVKAIIIPEINYGQIVYEVERCAAGHCNIISLSYGPGVIPKPEELQNAIKRAAEEKKKNASILHYNT